MRGRRAPACFPFEAQRRKHLGECRTQLKIVERRGAVRSEREAAKQDPAKDRRPCFFSLSSGLGDLAALVAPRRAMPRRTAAQARGSFAAP